MLVLAIASSKSPKNQNRHHYSIYILAK